MNKPVKAANLKYLLGITLLYLSILLFIPIGFDFPLMDDWSYAGIAKTLAEKGKFEMTDWPSMSLVFHVLCGAFLIKIFGMKYSILHGFSFFMGLISIITFYFICLKFKIESKISFLASFLLMANPIFLCLSFTFMTDIFFLALSLISILFFVIGFCKIPFNANEIIPRSHIKYYICGLITSILAILIRQTALIIPISAGLALLFSKNVGADIRVCPNKKFLSWVLILITFPILTLILFQLWQSSSFGIPGSLSEKLDFIKKDWHFGIIPFRTFSIFCYLGLFLLPLIFYTKSQSNRYYVGAGSKPALYPRVCPEQGKTLLCFKKNCFLLLITALFFGLFVFYSFSKGEISPFFPDDKISSLFPYFENVITNFSIGPLTLRDTYILHYPPPFQLPLALIFIISIIGFISGSFIFFSLIKTISSLFTTPKNTFAESSNNSLIQDVGANGVSPSDTACRASSNILPLFITLISVLYILQMFLYNKPFDRYINFLLPFFSLLLLSPKSNSYLPELNPRKNYRMMFYISALLASLYFIISIAGVHDYISWNKARWNGINYLLNEGISPSSIDGGFEFNGLYTYNSTATYTKSQSNKFIVGTGRDLSTGEASLAHKNVRNENFRSTNTHFQIKPPKNLSWWWVIDDEYIISFNKLPDYEILKKIPYKTYLPPSKNNILLLKHH